MNPLKSRFESQKAQREVGPEVLSKLHPADAILD